MIIINSGNWGDLFMIYLGFVVLKNLIKDIKFIMFVSGKENK